MFHVEHPAADRRGSLDVYKRQVLYFVVSNFWRVGQQWFIGRHIYGKDDDGAIEVSSRESSTDDDEDSGPKGLRGLFTGQIEATRNAREDAKAAKADKADKDSSAKKPANKPASKAKPKSGGAGSTNGRGGSSRTNGRPTSAAKGAGSSGQGASLPQPKPRKKKKR